MCVTVTALGIFPVKKKFKFYYYRTCVCIHITFRSQFLPCVKVLFFMPVSPVLLRQFSSLLLVVGVLSYRCTHCTCFLSCHPHPHPHPRCPYPVSLCRPGCSGTLRKACLCLPSTGIKSVHHHTWSTWLSCVQTIEDRPLV